MKQKQVWVKRLLLWLVLLLGAAFPSAAEEAVETLTIKECAGVAYNGISIRTTRARSGYDIEVYRADAAAGPYSLIDTVPYRGSWTSTNGSVFYKYGKKKQVACADYDTEYVFINMPVSFRKTYYYKFRLVDPEDGTAGAFSNVGSAYSVVEAPQMKRAYRVSAKKAKVSWTKVSGAQGYIVYRKVSGGGWKKIKTIKKGSTVSWTDSSVKNKKTYQYRVRAYRKRGGKTYAGSYSSAVKVKMKNPTVKGNYKKGTVYGPSLSTGKLSEVRSVVQSFKDNYIKKGMSDYDKLLTAYNYIRSNCGYAWRGWQYNGANTAWGALVYGEAQCSGFARGMKALCDAIGVPCKYVHANSKSANPSHQWNQVRIGGKWYILDAQGGFFLVSAKTYQSTGMRWNTKGLPKCSKDHARGGFTGSVM